MEGPSEEIHLISNNSVDFANFSFKVSCQLDRHDSCSRHPGPCGCGSKPPLWSISVCQCFPLPSARAGGRRCGCGKCSILRRANAPPASCRTYHNWLPSTSTYCRTRPRHQAINDRVEAPRLHNLASGQLGPLPFLPMQVLTAGVRAALLAKCLLCCCTALGTCHYQPLGLSVELCTRTFKQALNKHGSPHPDMIPTAWSECLACRDLQAAQRGIEKGITCRMITPLQTKLGVMRIQWPAQAFTAYFRLG